MDPIYTIALSLTEGVGGRTLPRLAELFGSPRAVLEAPSEALEAAGITPALVRSLVSSPGGALERARALSDFCRGQGVRILVRGSEGYPAELLECSDAPWVLYVRGEVDFNAGRWLSVVGTRNATPHGVSACDRMIRDIALNFPDAVIVSGLAFGIDKAAHLAALKYGLKTVAVMAGWVDDIVPRSHYGLARQILAAGGAMVSDMPPGTIIRGGNFLSRNRIVAGLGSATVVVESAIRGGSLVTADLASSYEKALFAHPGRTDDPASEGTNALIHSNKAEMYHSVEDVAQALRWRRSTPVLSSAADTRGRLSEKLQRVLDILPAGADADHFDLEQAAEWLGVELHEASSLLGQLMARGLVACDPYRLYYVV